MKITGSKGFPDSLFGGAGIDQIYGDGGDDLISAWSDEGGAGDAAADKVYAGDGNDLVSGFSVDFGTVARSGSRGALINGGNGYDMLIVDATTASKVTSLGEVHRVVDIMKVEEIIYNFSAATTKQRLLGTNANDTIYIGESGSTVDGGNGHDYLFGGSGDDILVGGTGDDFLSAAGGRNTLTGGNGADYFQFHITQDYSYSNITDFEKGVDKIALVLDLVDFEYETEPFGDGLRTIDREMDAMGYLDYDRGRIMGKDLFAADADYFAGSVIYEQETGSFIQRFYLEEGEGVVEYDVLLAHLDNKPKLDASDFVFMIY
jgi:hypothetical protein